ncbi:ribosomal large subunit pseudouridine synthase A [Thiomicrospira aerophila AL3]|uniref:Dual-specificity RNA pseudouridine synthase RluA n=1 Tax=Thiomicrospira aerophila AL3 TaxID=717772 RepID=W0DXF5_9GAMM|nr:RluA family pseudouridine synthase [Thiomicrospira aerophila]AHF01649.1 ribosomal large subunit pseudouridine synthase A [Thiomicrospira aerophila AL3]
MSSPNHFSQWIIYEDDCLLAINKPSGILSVPGKPPNPTPCVQDYFPSQHAGLLTIHRLDMDTSGILLLAKTKASHRFMSMAFQNRQTSKVYQAVCAGRLEQPAGTIQLPMRCDWANRPRQCIDFVQGRYAQTRWQVIAQKEAQFSVALFPITGRSHQLRLHMKMLGHPILGDTLYADQPAQQAVSRLLLHASELHFEHPANNQTVHLINTASFL